MLKVNVSLLDRRVEEFRCPEYFVMEGTLHLKKVTRWGLHTRPDSVIVIPLAMIALFEVLEVE